MAVWNTIPRSAVTNRLRIEAEFYRPEFLRCYEIMSKISHSTLRQNAEMITDGTHFTPHYKENGIRFYSAVNVLEGKFDYEGTYKYISNSEHAQIHKRCPVKSQDVLLRKVGVGPRWSCVVPEGLPEFSIFVSVALLRPKACLDPHFLSVFINTSYGQLQLLRLNKGSSQPDLHLEDIGELLIPVVSSAHQKQVVDLAKKAERAEAKALVQYQEAKRILSSALRMDDLRFEHLLSYTANFSDVMAQGRADADYFQIPYVQVHSHLDRFEWRPLSQLVDFVKGVEVGSDAYENSGKLFLRVSNVTERGLKYNTSDKYIGRKLYDQLRDAFEPQVGELLLTKDGTPGVCWVVDQPVEGIVSGALVRLVPKQKDVPQEYLALAINSILCRMQVEQNASGALILHWKLPLIKKLRVPLCDQDVMKRIATLVKESKKQHYKSVALLEEAKARVEQLIEEAANRA